VVGGRCHLNIVAPERIGSERPIVPGVTCAVAPNDADTEAFRPDLGRAEGLVFGGKTTWFPNNGAQQYFCDEVLPNVCAGRAVKAVGWVGRASDEARRRYQDRHAVERTGHVAEVRPYVRDAACYVVPLRVGGGLRVNILDAWAMGKAVVSPSVGCEGLAAEDGPTILIQEDLDSFARAARAVLQDEGYAGGSERRGVGRLSDTTVGSGLASPC
jgi:hypothetical protein